MPRAFATLDLSSQYAAATSDSQRAMLTAAGQAMLSVGQRHNSRYLSGILSFGSCRHYDLDCDVEWQSLQ